MQTNLEILESLLNAQPNPKFHINGLIDFSQFNTINQLPKLNHYNPNEPDKIFLYDHMEQAIYYSTDKRDLSLLSQNDLITETPGIKIYHYQFC